jgi:hypothetical protein
MCVYTHMTAAHTAVISPLGYILPYTRRGMQGCRLPFSQKIDRSVIFYILHKSFVPVRS